MNVKSVAKGRLQSCRIGRNIFYADSRGEGKAEAMVAHVFKLTKHDTNRNRSSSPQARLRDNLIHQMSHQNIYRSSAPALAILASECLHNVLGYAAKHDDSPRTWLRSHALHLRISSGYSGSIKV